MDNFDLRNALRQYRKRNKLSGKKMSVLLGISKSAYQRRESGTTQPTYLQAIDMQRKLNLEWPVPLIQDTAPPAEVPAKEQVLIVEKPQLIIEDPPLSTFPPNSPPPKWYQSKMWRLMFPFCLYAFFSVVMDTRGFVDAVGGEEEIARHPKDIPAMLVTLVITAIYWWFRRPELPFINNKSKLNWIKKYNCYGNRT